MATVEEALALAARGFRVFPLRVGDWRPAIKDWPALATTNEAQIRAWWRLDYNIGVATGQGLLVLDIDRKKDKDGYASLEGLGIRADTLGTFTVETPTGGGHAYFTGPDVSNSRDQLGRGLDIRSRGGYVVGPGSILREGVKDGQPGGVYRVIHDQPLAVVPAGLLDRLPACTEHSAGDVRSDVSVSTAVVESGLRFLQGEVAAHRDQGSFQTALHLRDLGLDEATCLELMDQHWNGHRERPRTYEHLTFKVHNAFTYGENPQGFRSVETTFAGVDLPPVPAKVVDHLAGVRWHGVDTWDRNETWLFDQILPSRGVAAILGPSQSAKSFMVLELARALATGKPFFEVAPDEMGGTVFLFAGTEGSDFRKRIEALQETEALPIADMDVGNLSGRGALGALLEAIRRVSSYMASRHRAPLRLVVLETLSASGLLQDELSNPEAAQAIANLNQIAKALDVLVVFTHHPPKGGAGSRGASAITDNADYVLEIKREPGDKVRRVYLQKARGAEQRALGSFTLVPVYLDKDTKGRDVYSMCLSTGSAVNEMAKQPRFLQDVLRIIDGVVLDIGEERDGRTWCAKADVWAEARQDATITMSAFNEALGYAERHGVIELSKHAGSIHVCRREIM